MWCWTFRGLGTAASDPVLIGRYQRRFPDIDDKIITLYARGMIARDIQRQ